MITGIGLIAAHLAVTPLPIVLWAVAGLSLLCSAVIAGRTIARVSRSGARGTWKLSTSRNGYSQQALAFIVGATLYSVGTAMALGDRPGTREYATKANVRTLEVEQARQQRTISRLTRELRRVALRAR
jgi:hypothetical protein